MRWKKGNCRCWRRGFWGRKQFSLSLSLNSPLPPPPLLLLRRRNGSKCLAPPQRSLDDPASPRGVSDGDKKRGREGRRRRRRRGRRSDGEGGGSGRFHLCDGRTRPGGLSLALDSAWCFRGRCRCRSRSGLRRGRLLSRHDLSSLWPFFRKEKVWRDALRFFFFFPLLLSLFRPSRQPPSSSFLLFLRSSVSTKTKMSNPVVFFDITADGAPLGRIEMTVSPSVLLERESNFFLLLRPMTIEWPAILTTASVFPSPFLILLIQNFSFSMRKSNKQLRSDVVPKTAENFRALCTGEREKREREREEFWRPIVDRVCLFFLFASLFPCSLSAVFPESNWQN